MNILIVLEVTRAGMYSHNGLSSKSTLLEHEIKHIFHPNTIREPETSFFFYLLTFFDKEEGREGRRLGMGRREGGKDGERRKGWKEKQTSI